MSLDFIRWSFQSLFSFVSSLLTLQLSLCYFSERMWDAVFALAQQYLPRSLTQDCYTVSIMWIKMVFVQCSGPYSRKQVQQTLSLLMKLELINIRTDNFEFTVQEQLIRSISSEHVHPELSAWMSRDTKSLVSVTKITRLHTIFVRASN